MKVYFLSLGAGLLVGIVYSAAQRPITRAARLLTLVGLLGILVGEQVIPLAKSLMDQGAGRQFWIYQSSHRVRVTCQRQ